MTLDEAREFGVYLMALAALAEPHGTRAYLLALAQRDTRSAAAGPAATTARHVDELPAAVVPAADPTGGGIRDGDQCGDRTLRICRSGRFRQIRGPRNLNSSGRDGAGRHPRAGVGQRAGVRGPAAIRNSNPRTDLGRFANAPGRVHDPLWSVTRQPAGSRACDPAASRTPQSATRPPVG
jgi:hypothetical protein